MFDDLDKETKVALAAALAAGVVALSVTLMVKSGKKGPSLQGVGKILCEFTEMMEGTKTGKTVLKRVHKEVGSHEEMIHSAIDLASAGIELWKQFKKAS